METSYADLAGMLGISESGRSTAAPLEVIDRIQRGLPLAALFSVSEHVAPADMNFKFRIVSRSSLTRRKNDHKPLTADESNRLARLANVWTLAEKVWQDIEEARAFLFRRHPMLQGRKPIDLVIESELGADLVKDILGGLLYGTAA